MGDLHVALLGRSGEVGDGFGQGYSVSRVATFDEPTADELDTPDCVVIDADSLEIHVREAVEVATGRWPSASVVVGGSGIDEEGINEALGAGADQYLRGNLLEKTDVLESRIDRAVSSSNAENATDLPQYRTVLETIPEGVFVLDRDGTIVDANETAAELYNVDYDEFLGRPIMDLFVEGRLEREDLEAFSSIVQDLMTDESDEEFVAHEHPAYPTPDEERTYESRIALRPYDDQFRGTIGVVRDVTEQRERVRELERAEAIIDALPNMVFAVNDEGEFYYWNDRASEVTDLPESYSGENVRAENIMDDEGLFRYVEELRAVLSEETDRTRGTFEYRLRSFDGREVPIRAHFTPLFDESGELLGTAGIGRDISEQQRRKRRLTVLNRVLRHNLRNEIAKITGYADLIETTTDDEEVGEYAAGIDEVAMGLTEMAQHARRLQEVIRADISEDTTVDLSGLVSSVADGLAGEYPDAEIEYSVSGDCRVEGTEDLELAIREVLENAVVHNDAEAPSVEVSVGRQDGEVRVRVRDDGPGIPDQEQAIIVGNGDVTPLQHGSGLGLWVVKWVVDLFDGEVDIVNLAPHGSMVELRLRGA